MAKILIDIQDDVYRTLKEDIYPIPDTERLALVFKTLVKKGTSLPKGCGRIVDIDKLIDSKCNECGHVRGVSCTVPCYEVRRMLSAPIIIEADKE